MKMFKRNAVVAAIVLFVCGAVYLNWSYDQKEAAAETEAVTLAAEESGKETKTLGEAMLVSSDTLASEDEEIILDTWESESVTAEPAGEDDYFASARMSREEARSEALSILQGTVEDPEASEAAVTAAADSITAMASATLAESQIESLVTAKGYPECVAFIGDHSVSVVVSTASGTLEGADVAKITDIVMGETEMAASEVKVVLAE